MNIKTVKGILAAGTLTGIIMATMLGLGLRNITPATPIQSAPAVIASQPRILLANEHDGQQEHPYDEHEEHESWEFDDD